MKHTPSNMSAYVDAVLAIHERAWPKPTADHDRWAWEADQKYLMDRIQSGGVTSALLTLVEWIKKYPES